MAVFGITNRLVPDPSGAGEVHFRAFAECVRSLFDTGAQCDAAHALTRGNVTFCVGLVLVGAFAVGMGGVSVAAMMQDESSGGAAALVAAKGKVAAKRRELDVLQAEVELLEKAVPHRPEASEEEGRGMHA